MTLSLEQLLLSTDLPENTALFCGALPVMGGIRSADEFCMELFDPGLERKFRSSYRIVNLPIIA